MTNDASKDLLDIYSAKIHPLQVRVDLGVIATKGYSGCWGN